MFMNRINSDPDLAIRIRNPDLTLYNILLLVQYIDPLIVKVQVQENAVLRSSIW